MENKIHVPNHQPVIVVVVGKVRYDSYFPVIFGVTEFQHVEN